MHDPSEFAQLEQMGAAGSGDMGPGQDVQNALAPQMDNFRQLGANLGVANQAQQNPIPPSSLKVNTEKGTVDINGLSMEAYQGFLRDREQLNQIRGSFAMEAERLRQREQQVREQSPWIQLATALAANMAQAKDLPGWVQAAGKTSAQLNPQPDEIRNQRLAVLQQEANITEKTAGLDVANLRTLEGRADRMATAATAAETQRQKLLKEAYDNLEKAAGAGPGKVDPAVAQRILLAAGAKPDEVPPLLDQLKNYAANVAEAYGAKQKNIAEDNARAAAYLKIAAAGAASKADEKKLIDQAMELTAQSLAAGDLTSLKDVTSMRNHERSLVYARAKQINPNFDTKTVERKTATMASFSGNGRDAQAINSFDTFLQHAGEVTETLKGIELTNNKLMNKSLNWWRENMKGTPELARLETSLEPVGKEFMKFLIGSSTGSGALYTDDRKQAEKLLNRDQPISVILATVNQMGKTAQDRYIAVNHRFRRVMGQDIEDPFSPDARVAAAKIGITLPTGGESTSGPAPGAKDSGGLHNKVTKPEKGVTKSGVSYEIVGD